MSIQLPFNISTQGPSLASFAVNNGTLTTAVNNITYTNKTRILSVDNQTTIAPTQNVAREDMSVFSIILVVIYIPFFLVAVIGNITVIVVRLKKSMHHRLSAYKQLICHLSLADLLYVTAIPLAIYQRVNSKDWIQNRIVCKLLLTTQSASTTASASILAAMAFERYQGISNPLAHRWSTKKVLLLVAVIWTYSYVNFIPYAIALGVKSGSCCDDQYPHPDFGKWYTLYQFLSAWLLPVVLIALLQFGMMLKLVTHQKTIKGSTYRSPGPEEGNSRGGNRRKPKRKMIKILVVIVTLFATLTLPTHIWYLWYEFSDRSKSERSGLEVLEIFTSLVYMHGAVNPIIYSIMDRSFREDVKLMLGLKSQKKESFCLHVLNGATQESFEH